MLVEMDYPRIYAIVGLSIGVFALIGIMALLLVMLILKRTENKKINQFDVFATSKYFKFKPGKVVRINQRLAYSLGESRITFYFNDIVELGIFDILTIPQISEAVLIPNDGRVLSIVIKKNSFYTWNECFDLIVSHIVTLMDKLDEPKPPKSE